MKTQDLVKLNLDELETELEKGSFSKSFLDSLLKAEKADKSPRKGAIELIEGAIAALDDEQDVPTKPEVIGSNQSLVTSGESYVVASSVRSLSFGFAGNKVAGEKVDPEWADFKQNDKLLASLIERGLVVKQ